jgi:WD40 repeat protein
MAADEEATEEATGRLADEGAFDAFISYRRQDAAAFARRLRNRLLQYRFPTGFSQEPTRRLRVYLDEIYERAADDFFEATIKPALRASQHLIIVQTPGALLPRADGQPNWLEREVAFFRSLPQPRQISVALAEGEMSDPLPAGLHHQLLNIERVDLRVLRSPVRFLPAGRQEVDRQLLKFIAPLHGVPDQRMPELHQEERKRTRRRQRNLLALGLLLSSILLGLLIWALISRAEAIAQRDAALARQLGAEAQLESDHDAAVMLALLGDAVSSSTDTQSMLLSALAQQPNAILYLHGPAEPDRTSFNSDASLLATAQPGSVAVWSLSDGNMVGSPLSIGVPETAGLFWSGKDRLFIVDGQARVHEWRPAAPSQPPRVAVDHPLLEELPETYAAASHDSRILAVSGRGQLRVWDTTNLERPIASIAKAEAEEFAISPAGARIAMVDGRSRLIIGQSGDLKPQVTWSAPAGQVTNLIFLSETELVFTLAADEDFASFHTFWSWNVTEGRPVRFAEGARNVSDLAAIPGTRRFLSVEADPYGVSLLRERDVAEPDTIAAPLRRKAQIVDDVAVSRDGRLAASVSRDGQRTIYDLQRINLQRSRVQHAIEIAQIAYAGDGGCFVAGWVVQDDARQAALANCEQPGARLLPLSTRDEYPEMAFDAKLGLLAVGAQDGLWVLHLPSRQVAQLRGAGPSPFSLRFAPDGAFLIEGSSGNYDHPDGRTESTGAKVLRWRLPFGGARAGVEVLFKEPAMSKIGFSDIALRGDGLVAVGSGNGLFLIHSDGRVRHEQLGGAPVHRVAFAPATGRLGVVVILDGQHRFAVIDPHAPRLLSPRGRQSGPIANLAFSPDGQMLFTGGVDRVLDIWHLATLSPLGSRPRGHASAIGGMAVAPDGAHVASFDDDNSVAIWPVSRDEWRRTACKLVNRQPVQREAERAVLPAGSSIC